ncbi:MAG: argininosuccinate lyase, partial [Gammaproteobacteria bacterium]
MTKKGGWNKRLAAPLGDAARFNASVGFDWRLAEVDIAASIAHAEMLAAQKIIAKKDAAAIRRGLLQIGKEIRAGKFVWREEYEDVHLNIEKRLTDIIGDAGRKLHTARSRNDQVATDIRLWLREQSDALCEELYDARRALLTQAQKHAKVLMPGMTHLQPAQPITFAHHLLAYDDMLARDIGRLADGRRRLNIMPLGAGALAGVGYPIDRARVAAALGFEGVCQNAADAVSARDFAIEFASAAAMLMAHLSRFCEEVILWMSPAFGFISLPDGLCTG